MLFLISVIRSVSVSWAVDGPTTRYQVSHYTLHRFGFEWFDKILPPWFFVGYEIVQKVKELTDAKIQLTEGALYPTLHSLQKSGELDIEKQYMGKRVRKYYTLTEQGLNTAEKKVSEFAEFIETMKFLLDLEPRMNNA